LLNRGLSRLRQPFLKPLQVHGFIYGGAGKADLGGWAQTVILRKLESIKILSWSSHRRPGSHSAVPAAAAGAFTLN